MYLNSTANTPKVAKRGAKMSEKWEIIPKDENIGVTVLRGKFSKESFYYPCENEAEAQAMVVRLNAEFTKYETDSIAYVHYPPKRLVQG